MDGTIRALLLAGRLGPDGPIALEEVAGRPLIGHWIDALTASGAGLVRVSGLGEGPRSRALLAAEARPGGPILEAAGEPSSAGVLAANLDLLDGAEAVFVIRSWGFSDADLAGMLDFHRSHGGPLTVLLSHASDAQGRPRPVLDVAKRVVATDGGDLAEAGVYLASPSAFRELAEAGGDDPAPAAFSRFSGRLRGWPWAWYHREVLAPEDLPILRDEAPAILADRNRPGRPAVFLDRDGTLIEHVHYLDDPARVRLLPGVPEALRRLRAGGFARVVVTNQSAIGRGTLTEARLHAIHEEMHRQLDAEGAAVDAVFYCPDVPGLDDRSAVEGWRRKPGPGMLIAAATELGLDLASSWMVGDLVSDLLAGVHAGCRGSILVHTGGGLSPEEAALDVPHREAADLEAAADIILGQDQGDGRDREHAA